LFISFKKVANDMEKHLEKTDEFNEPKKKEIIEFNNFNYK